jgi:hypothetical protein
MSGSRGILAQSFFAHGGREGPESQRPTLAPEVLSPKEVNGASFYTGPSYGQVTSR